MDGDRKRLWRGRETSRRFSRICRADLNESGTERQSRILMSKIVQVSGNGYCAIGHKVGDKIEIDHFGVKGDICINALFTMLPVAYAMMHNSYFPWSKDQCKELHACPDPHNPVVFELDRSEAMDRKATS